MNFSDEASIQPAERAAMRAPLGQLEGVARGVRIALLVAALVALASFSVAVLSVLSEPAAVLPTAALCLLIVGVAGGVVVYWIRRKKMTAAMREVAHLLSGTLTLDDVGVVLDWLDRYWPWPTTALLLAGNVGARRWCAQGGFAGRAVLVTAFRRAQIRSQPALHRIDVLVSLPGGRPPRPELVSALRARANSVGFTVAALDFGVHIACYDSDPRSVAPEQLTPLVQAACDALG